MIKRVLVCVIMLYFCLYSANISFISAATPKSTNEIENSVDSGNGFNLVCQNSYGELYAVTSGVKSGEFYLLSKKDGIKWYSNPQNNVFDVNAPEQNAELNSQLTFQLYNEKTDSIKNSNSFAASDYGTNVKLTIRNDGFDVAYGINNNTIIIPLSVTLCNDGLSVSCDVSKIEARGTSHVQSVSILPYFGCADYNSSGYTFVPDGSGAIIYHSNLKVKSAPYSQRIYGQDLAFASDTKTSDAETAHLPVFGIKNDYGTLFAIIRQGAEAASVKAAVALNTDTYNKAYPSFEIIGKDEINLGESGTGENSADEIYAVDMPLVDNCEVFYTFLKQGSGYSDMALYYKEYLNLKKGDTISSPSLFLELYGGINKKQSVLGIPVTMFKKLTTISQAEKMISYFKDNDINSIVVSYRSIDSAVITNKIQNKLRINYHLGSKKDLSSLNDTLDEKLYLENDIFSASKSGNGFSKFSQSSSRINREQVIKYSYNPSTTNIDSSKTYGYAIKPASLQKICEKYLDSVHKYGFKTAFINLGNSLYSDFSKKVYTNRSAARNMFENILTELGEDSLLYSPNAYALDCGKYITNVPVTSSNYDLTDEDVPFYEILISGVKEYSTPSLNLQSDFKRTFLRAVESGASVKFTLVYNNITDIKGTDYDYLFGTNYSDWKKTIVDCQKQLNQISLALNSKVIVRHDILAEDVRLTTYENGNAVIVNYSDKAVTTDYGTVEANSYLLVTE